MSPSQTVNMGGNRVQGVADATDAKDATNLGQVESLLSNSSWTLKNGAVDGGVDETAENLEAEKINPNDQLQLQAGKNLKVKREANGVVTYATQENVTFNNVTAKDVNTGNLIATGNTVLNTLTVEGATRFNKGFVVTPNQEIDMGGNRVQGVADATNEKDATNLGQVESLLSNSSWTLKNGAVDGGVDEAAENLEAEKINPNDQLQLQAGKNLKVKREANGVVTYATQDNVTFNNVTAKDVNTGNLMATGNTLLNMLTVGGAARFNGGFSVAPNQVIDMGGNRIQNIGKAEAGTDAVNLDVLKESISQIQTELTNLGMNFQGNSGNSTVALGNTLAITGDATSEGNYSSGNVKTVVTDGKVEIQLAEKPIFEKVKANEVEANIINAKTINSDKIDTRDLNSENATISENLVSTGNTTLGGQGKELKVVNGTTIDMGGNRIQNVADAQADSDAVNYKQLKETNTELSKGWNLTTSQSGTGIATSTTNEQINMGELVTLDAGNNIHLTQQGNKISIATSMNPTFDSATIGGKDQKFAVAKGTEIDMGNNVIKNVADGDISPDSKQLVNGGQIYLIQQTAQAGWNLTANGQNNTNVKPTDTVDLNNQDGNIKIEKEGHNVSFNLANNVNLGDSGSLKIGGITVTNGGVNAGNTKITNLAEGSVAQGSRDAVTGEQLYRLQSIVDQGWNITAGVVENSNGIANNAKPTRIGMGNTFNMNAGQNIVITQNGQGIDISTLMTPTFNALKINPKGSVDMGGNRIQNVGNAIKPTDALNYGQFKAEVGKIDRRLRSGIAGAVASASLVQAFNPSESLLAVGGGTYRGASAVALGYSKVSDNGKFIIKVTGSANNHGDYTGGASIGFKF